MVDESSLLVGKRLKTLRAERALTLRDLAQASDLSLNTISLIERGQISPTVATLHKLATALGVTIADFVEEEPQQEVIFQKRAQRLRARSAKAFIESIGVRLPGQTIMTLLITLEPEAQSGPEPITHAGHELVFCLEGRVTYEIGETQYLLEPEDSLIFEAYLPHRWRNEQSDCSRFLLILEAAEAGAAKHH